VRSDPFMAPQPAVEWPTLGVMLGTYSLWAWATTGGYEWSPILGILLTGIAIAQFSSLQHEVLHGHPFRSPALNEALVFPALTLTIPYGRFRDTHLAHHHDPNLTDPYDDPESNFLDPEVWARLPEWRRMLYRANNTLLGRIVIGPLLGNAQWLYSEAALLRRGAGQARRDWLLHAGGLLLLVLWIVPAQMPLWAYGLAAYLGQAFLKVRTFLEHRAHEQARARTVIVQDRGPLSILFLNNNFHSVHHCHPQIAWYRLPALYAAKQAQFHQRNEDYVYRSYGQIFRLYFLRMKDPVPHPLMAPDQPNHAPATREPEVLGT